MDAVGEWKENGDIGRVGKCLRTYGKMSQGGHQNAVLTMYCISKQIHGKPGCFSSGLGCSQPYDSEFLVTGQCLLVG